jgi:DNA-binding NarL/FixJ family response regulator
MIRVVLADDQTLVRQGIRGLLELTGEIEVVGEAQDGEAAIQQIRALGPDLALLDVRMPKKNGLEVVGALRAAGDRTPIVFLTTFDDDAVLRDGVRAGIAGYLLKDVDSAGLLDALRRVARGETLVLPSVGEHAASYVKKANTAENAAPAEALTPRELEVLRLMARGYSNREIADTLGTAEGTVKNQISSVLSKLGVRDRTRAVLKALEQGWLA